MSRKRKQNKRAAGSAPVEAVPEEILAEGSGPVGPVDAEKLAEAANAVGRRRKQRREPKQGPEVSTGSASAAQSDEVSADGEAGREGSVDAGEGELAAASDGLSEEAADVEGGADLDEETAEAAGIAEAGDDGVDPEGVAGEEELVAAAADPEVVAAGPDGEVAEELAGDPEAAAEAGELGAVLPTSAASLDATQLKHLVEALVFASDKPLTIARLRQLTRVSDTKRLEQALDGVAEDFRERGIILQQVSGGYQFRTRTQFSGWVQQLIAGRPVRLSRAQLETLAIIAYRQPITRPEIDDIRGVDSSATLKLLIDRALIRILGKKEEVGRPMLYGTTKEFLDFFSLGDLRELPTLREYSELTDESRQVMSARLGIELDETASAAEGAEGIDRSGNGHDGNGSNGNGNGSNGNGGNGNGSHGFEPEGFDAGEVPGGDLDVGASAISEEDAAHVGEGELPVEEAELAPEAEPAAEALEPE